MKSLSAVFVLVFYFQALYAKDTKCSDSISYLDLPREQSWSPSKRIFQKEISFSYENDTGPENWASMFKECGGRKQSPIDINMGELVNLTVKKPLKWSSMYFIRPEVMTVMDDGHTLELKANYGEDEHPQLSCGPLKGNYVFKRLHFHWSTCNQKGSEHTIDGRCHPMEMHIIHQKECSSNKSEQNENKYAVVAYFFQVCEEGSPTLDRIIQVMYKAMKNPHRAVKLKHYFNLGDLFKPFTCDYITYDGSLTTPPCTESVTWIINPYPIGISKKQIESFRSSCSYDPDLKDNFRPVQPLNGRTVHIVQ